MLCPVARELVKRGVMPFPAMEHPYQTGEEYKTRHDRFKDIVHSSIVGLLDREGMLVSSWREMETCMTLLLGEAEIPVFGKADIVVLAKTKAGLLMYYVEVSSTKINVAKPYQTYFRALSLYYRLRIPVAIIIVSPYEVRYRHLTDIIDIDRKGRVWRLEQLLRAYSKSLDLEELRPANPNLCSLCDLRQFCPHVEG